MDEDNKTMYFDALKCIINTIKMNNIRSIDFDEYEIFRIKMLFKKGVVRKFRIRVICDINESDFGKLLLGSLMRTKLKNIIKITIYFDNGKLKAIHYFNDDTDQLNILRKEMIKNYVGVNTDSINAIIKS
jgi:hypothetical protein